jgi:gluconate 5-dehydrogenase
MPSSPFPLTDRSILVAGASRGIGLRLAEACAEQGARVVSCGRSTIPAREHAAIRYIACDLTDQPSTEQLASRAATATGSIDVLLFAAAISLPTETGLQPLTDFTRTLEANLVAAYQLVLAADRFLAPNASIILISSINASLGFPRNPGYVASKGGLRQLARGLAVDLAPRGIRVNTLAPGYIRTEMTESSFLDAAKHQARADRTLLGRWGTVEDLVGPMLFLASDASRYVTGHELIVDGGWTAKGL